MKQRNFERVGFPIEVAYMVPSKGNLEKEAQATNISLGGLELQLKEKLDVGTRFSLKIHFPRLTRMTLASGELVWLKEGGLPGQRLYNGGVRFIQADPFEFEELLRVVGRLASWQSSSAASSHPA